MESNVIGNPALRACLLLGLVMAAVGCSKLENAVKCRAADPDTRLAGCSALIQAGQIQPENLSNIYSSRGTAYDRKGDHDRAIQDYNEAILLNPKNAAAYLSRGESYYGKRDYDHSIEDLKEALRLSPNNAAANYDLGNAYGGRGAAYDNKDDYGHAIQEYNNAIQEYGEAIRVKPSYAFAYFGRGLAYGGRGIEHDNGDDYDHAIQDFNEAIRLRPNDAGAYRYRGFAYNHEGDYGRAIQDFNEAIRLNPKDAVAYLSRGVAYIRKGDYDRALQDFNEAIRLNPKDMVVYEARGDAYLFQSNLAAATSDFENAISGAPSSRAAVSWALMLHVTMKRQGRDDSRQLAQVAAAADLSKWPGPVLKLDMGKMTASEVMAAAASPGDERQKWHVCQANFFIGEDALFHHQQAAALVRLRAARDGCPKWDTGYVAAQAELGRLGATASPAH
jgi:tetratricopeptide (TPR) repeat protein